MKGEIMTSVEKIAWLRNCWVCGASLSEEEQTVCRFVHRKQFTVAKLNGNLGFVVRPTDGLDNSRWYFNHRCDAEDFANYLERTSL